MKYWQRINDRRLKNKDKSIKKIDTNNMIKFIEEINSGTCVRLTIPMCKEEHIMTASALFQELADETYSIGKLKKPAWDRLGRARRKISKESRNAKMYAEPESLGSTYKGAK